MDKVHGNVLCVRLNTRFVMSDGAHMRGISASTVFDTFRAGDIISSTILKILSPPVFKLTDLTKKIIVHREHHIS